VADLVAKAKTEEKKNMFRWNLNKLSETYRLPTPDVLRGNYISVKTIPGCIMVGWTSMKEADISFVRMLTQRTTRLNYGAC
jgi:hypothetical protein